MSRKIVIDTYTFTAASKTVDMPSVSGLQIEGIQLITNVVDNIIIYQFNNPAKGGTLSGTTLTLTFDTTSMSDTDQLMIIYDSPADSVTQPIIGGNSLPMSSLTSAVGVGIVDGSGNQMGEASNPIHIFEDNFTYTSPPISSSVNVTPVGVVDGSGNQTGITGNPMIVEPTATVTVPAASAGTAIAAAIVDASGNQITSFGGGTEYSTASAAPTDPVAPTLVFEDGSGNWQNVGAGGGFGAPLPVDIKSSVTVDVNVVSGATNTQYTEGDTDASFTGTIALGEKPGDEAFPLQLDSSGNLNVNVVTGGTSGTQYAEGDALGATPTGTAALFRNHATDVALLPTAQTAGATKVPLHVITVDNDGNNRPPATLYQEVDTSSTNDLAPGIAWKDEDNAGNWHITSLTDPLPITSVDRTVSNTVAMGSTLNSQDISTIYGGNTVSVQITGTWTGTLIFEGTVNGTDWFSVSLFPIGTYTRTSTVTANGQWVGDCSGLIAFRVRCSVVGTSTAIVDARISTASIHFPTLIDSSGTSIASATSSPAGTENGLVVRSIPQTSAGTASFTGSAQAITLTNVGGMSTALIYISGTFSATIIPQVSMDNGTTYANVSTSPGVRRIYCYTYGTWVYEITASGLYGINISGANAVKLNCAAYTSGTVTAKMSVSPGGTLPIGKMNHTSVAISASSSGNNTIITATAGTRIKVTSWNFVANGSVNAKFTDGAGGSDLTGLYYMIANTGISVPYNEDGYFILTTNTALVLNLSAAVAVGGVLTYTHCDRL